MPKPISLTPRRSAWTGTRQWAVNVPASIAPSGKRERYFFATRADADNYAETQRTKLKNFGVSGTAILSPALQDQAANAVALLQPYGVTLNEVVKQWIAQKQAAEASVTFEEAMDEFAKPTKERRRSDSYARSLRQTKTRLVHLHGRLLNQITPADITRATDGMPPSVKNFTLRILAGLFHFGKKRDYCADIPTLKVDGAKHERGEIAVYSPEDSAKILHAAEKHDPVLVPYFALSFFAGIRLSEMQRLDWSTVDLTENFVKLPAAITKTRQGRHIDISPTLAAWLNPYAKKAGKVLPCTPDALRNRVATLRGIHGVPTIKHGPRHCFASYWLAQHGDINQLCRFLGHDDPETTFKHYAKAATKADAAKFWAIMPKKRRARQPKPKNVIPLPEVAA